MNGIGMAKKITIECEVTISDGELTPAEREKIRKERKRLETCEGCGCAIALLSFSLFCVGIVTYICNRNANGICMSPPVHFLIIGSFFFMWFGCWLCLAKSRKEASKDSNDHLPYCIRRYL